MRIGETHVFIVCLLVSIAIEYDYWMGGWDGALSGFQLRGRVDDDASLIYTIDANILSTMTRKYAQY